MNCWHSMVGFSDDMSLTDASSTANFGNSTKPDLVQKGCGSFVHHVTHMHWCTWEDKDIPELASGWLYIIGIAGIGKTGFTVKITSTKSPATNLWQVIWWNGYRFEKPESIGGCMSLYSSPVQTCWFMGDYLVKIEMNLCEFSLYQRQLRVVKSRPPNLFYPNDLQVVIVKSRPPNLFYPNDLQVAIIIKSRPSNLLCRN